MKVSLYADYSPAELVEAVEQAFEAAGIEAGIATDRKMPEAKGPGANGGPWLVELFFDSPLMMLLGASAGAAGIAFGKAAGEDAWKALKAFVTIVFDRIDELWPPLPGAAKGHSGAVILSDEDGLDVVIGQDVSDEALEALCEMDLLNFKRGSLIWDEERKKWRLYSPRKLLGWLPFWRRNG